MASTRSRRNAQQRNSISSSSKLEEEMAKKHQFSMRCRCCLDISGELKNMWDAYKSEGSCETYGEMLIECFSLPWHQPDHQEKICDMCISRLRDAFSFKKDILEAEHYLLEQLDLAPEVSSPKKIKVEPKTEAETEVSDPDDDNIEFVLDEEYTLEEEEEDQQKAEYLDIEYLEEDVGSANQPLLIERTEPKRKCLMKKNEERGTTNKKKEERGTTNKKKEECGTIKKKTEERGTTKKKTEERGTTNKRHTEEELKKCIQAVPSIDCNQEQTEPKRKWPKKKKKEDRLVTYKKYTDEELKKAMQAVQSELMSRSEAASYYKVPVKTLGAKLRAEQIASTKDSSSEEEEEEDEDEIKKRQNLERHQQFIEEIKIILTYFNATPYKTRSGRYRCAYCSTTVLRKDSFEDPDELRTHCRIQHAQERLRGVELFMRPMSLNEVLKLDIENLQCTVCCTSIEKWNDLFTHLQFKHDVELIESYTRVVPFKLNNDLSCALCDQKYPVYNNLDTHMNCHYNNYICGDCGDSFLSETRMKKHLERHSVGRFPCEFCGKEFTLEKYRKKHVDFVHNKTKEPNVKCLYCTEKFESEYARYFHVRKQHRDKLKIYPCEICGKEYDWRPYYLKHMRLTHGKKEKKHKCKLCSKAFSMSYELKNHEDWHNDGNNFVCAICKKKFTSKAYLQKHYTTHVDTTVVIVEK